MAKQYNIEGIGDSVELGKDGSTLTSDGTQLEVSHDLQIGGASGPVLANSAGILNINSRDSRAVTASTWTATELTTTGPAPFTITTGGTISNNGYTYTGLDGVLAFTNFTFPYDTTRRGVYVTIDSMSNNNTNIFGYTDGTPGVDATTAVGINATVDSGGIWTFTLGEFFAPDLDSGTVFAYTIGEMLCIAVDSDEGTYGTVRLYHESDYVNPILSYALTQALAATPDRFTSYAASTDSRVVSIVETPGSTFTGVSQYVTTIYSGDIDPASYPAVRNNLAFQISSLPYPLKFGNILVSNGDIAVFNAAGTAASALTSTGGIAQTITNGVTTSAPSQDAVYDALALKIDTTLIGASGGVASLDGSGKVPVTQLPSAVFTYEGVWDANGNTPAIGDGTGSPGMVYRVTVAGTINLGSGSITFDVGDYVIYNTSAFWEKSDTTDAIEVSDTAYAGSWDGVTTIAPSKNAVYDKIESMITQTITNGVTTSAPSEDTVYDALGLKQDISSAVSLGGTNIFTATNTFRNQNLKLKNFSGTTTGLEILTSGGALRSSLYYDSNAGDTTHLRADVGDLALSAVGSAAIYSGASFATFYSSGDINISATGTGNISFFVGTGIVELPVGSTISSNVILSTLNISDTVYGAGWNGVTTIAPSKNAVYDKIELLAPLASPTFTGTVTVGSGGPTLTDTSGQLSINGSLGVMNFVNHWNPSTNTPTLSNATGTTASIYRASVDGTVNFGAGDVSFKSGDWAFFGGTVWQIIQTQVPEEYVQWKGNWNANTNSPTLADGGSSAQGSLYRVSVAGTQAGVAAGVAFSIGDFLIYSGSVFYKIGAGGSVDDTAYPTGWNGDTTAAPSRNAVYDKINGMISDTVYGAGWDGVTDVAPSKNAVYDKVETLVATVSNKTATYYWNGASYAVASNPRIFIGPNDPSSPGGGSFTLLDGDQWINTN